MWESNRVGEVLFKSHSIVPPSAAVGRGVTSVKETELFLCRSSKKFSDSHLCSQSSNVNMKPVKKSAASWIKEQLKVALAGIN